jgi:lambda repressor-like predicted transcriptional regulator
MDGGKAKMQTDKLKFWKRKLQEYRKSGLSRRAFSEQNGVNKSTLDYWFARIRKGQKATQLVEVNPAPVVIQNPALHVVVSDKYRIELHRGFDPILLGEVVKALESV